MHYWLQFWWPFPIALAICILVCLVGIEGSIIFAPFYAVFFPWLSGRLLSALEAIQIGLISEIFGFTNSFVGFFRAKLIDYRLALLSAAVGAPLAALGAFFAYRLSQPVLLLIIASVLPVMAWYLQREHRRAKKAGPSRETAEQAAQHIPMCCYASEALYLGQPEEQQQPAPANPGEQHEHRDRRGRVYRYGYRGGKDRAAVSALGGLSTGLVGVRSGQLPLSHRIGNTGW